MGINQQKAGGIATQILVSANATVQALETRFSAESASYVSLLNAFKTAYPSSFTLDQLLSFIKLQVIEATGATGNVMDVNIPQNLKGI
jgi:hypothetical protein